MTLPPLHRAFLERALPVFRADARLAGVGVGGSLITGEMGEHSDLVVVSGRCSPPSREITSASRGSSSASTGRRCSTSI